MIRRKSDLDNRELSKKELVRIRLVNWHFFSDETIELGGMTLITGENTAGKSTILDAIQMVLTTNTRRFNQAANENSKRSLKGYVRCKIGDVGEAYLRKNTVPANVALEFYEEKNDRYFVLGVHLLSHNEESDVVKKWYCEECRLEDLSFIVNGKAALFEDFRNRGHKVNFCDTEKAARDRFRHRMGDMDEKFFYVIPKALAFKPMDRVKEFINRFVLSDEKVDVNKLRENIETLNELEDVLKRTNNKIRSLSEIIEMSQKINDKESEMRMISLMIKIARKDAMAEMIRQDEADVRAKRLAIEDGNVRLKTLQDELKRIDEQIVTLNVSIRQNEASQLAEEIRRRISELKRDQEGAENRIKKLSGQTGALYDLQKALGNIGKIVLGKDNLSVIDSPIPIEEKREVFEKLSTFFAEEFDDIRKQTERLDIEMSDIDENIRGCEEKLRRLEQRKLDFPPNAEALRSEIEKEYKKRGIDSRVSILAELLEITDEKWRNAVEGYLNTQKFYIVIEPEYYDIALSVYDRARDRIHGAGIINTKKLPMDIPEDHRSLSFVVKSENRYAKSYINYLLSRVIRVDRVEELEEYDVAITPFCMLYQGYVVRHIDPKNYRDPYIGMQAYLVQIENVRSEIDMLREKKKELSVSYADHNEVKKAGDRINMELLRMYAGAPYEKEQLSIELGKAETQLAAAQDDPSLIELNMRLQEVQKLQEEKQEENKILYRKIVSLEEQQKNLSNMISEHKSEMSGISDELLQDAEEDRIAYKEAEDKYGQTRKKRSPKQIADNYPPRLATLTNERDDMIKGMGGLVDMQIRFNADFMEEFPRGMEGMKDYLDSYEKLEKIEVFKYEEKVRQAKEECEEIFRSDFLAKMKERIENARTEFRQLNRALSDVYYGEDSYHFTITFDKKKEGLYRMITSDSNMGVNTLWTAEFEKEYHEEMTDLFDKLMVHDDRGEKVVEEYTDYRNYLDYDIEIVKRDGRRQRFSEIYGEKSGSETQVPFYVAIAASFYQIYRFGNTIRLMLLDEAFDKMDADRIEPMLKFFEGLGLQVIMATPPEKMEVIGEYVDTILTAIRVGKGSIVEEYEL